MTDKSIPIEQQLNSVFIHLYRTVVFDAVKATKAKTKEEERKLQWIAYEEITRQRAIDVKQKAEEHERRKILIAEAGHWQEAQNIRAYAAHILAMAEAPASPQALDWSDWAKSTADQLDPSGSRLAALFVKK